MTVSRYRPSMRAMPDRVPEVEYDEDEIVRTVSTTKHYISFKGRHWKVPKAFRGEDEAFLLERNADLLLAMEHLAHRWLKLDPRLHDRVRFDCGDYRASRLEELKLSARVAAQRVRETSQPFRFNPMSSRERRIIHLELNGAAGVRTVSEGAGDRRQLVIYPATVKK